MSLGHNCRYQSSQCSIQEITEFLLNILTSFFVQPLFLASNLNLWWHVLFLQTEKPFFFRFVYIYSAAAVAPATADIWINKSNFPWNMPIEKLSAQNNGWTKKNLRYSEKTPWCPEYYIGWIGISNCGQNTSRVYYHLTGQSLGNSREFHPLYGCVYENNHQWVILRQDSNWCHFFGQGTKN